MLKRICASLRDDGAVVLHGLAVIWLLRDLWSHSPDRGSCRAGSQCCGITTTIAAQGHALSPRALRNLLLLGLLLIKPLVVQRRFFPSPLSVRPSRPGAGPAAIGLHGTDLRTLSANRLHPTLPHLSHRSRMKDFDALNRTIARSVLPQTDLPAWQWWRIILALVASMLLEPNSRAPPVPKSDDPGIPLPTSRQYLHCT